MACEEMVMASVKHQPSLKRQQDIAYTTYFSLLRHQGHSARESGGRRDLRLLVDQSTRCTRDCSVVGGGGCGVSASSGSDVDAGCEGCMTHLLPNNCSTDDHLGEFLKLYFTRFASYCGI